MSQLAKQKSKLIELATKHYKVIMAYVKWKNSNELNKQIETYIISRKHKTLFEAIVKLTAQFTTSLKHICFPLFDSIDIVCDLEMFLKHYSRSKELLDNKEKITSIIGDFRIVEQDLMHEESCQWNIIRVLNVEEIYQESKYPFPEISWKITYQIVECRNGKIHSILTRNTTTTCYKESFIRDFSSLPTLCENSKPITLDDIKAQLEKDFFKFEIEKRNKELNEHFNTLNLNVDKTLENYNEREKRILLNEDLFTAYPYWFQANQDNVFFTYNSTIWNK